MDFSKVLIHASSMGVLFVEPKDVAAKKAVELSQTAKSHLIRVYIEEYWGRKKDITTVAMQKGTHGEEALIELLSRVDKRLYKKNTVTKSNKWAIGTCDIEEEDMIIDGKASLEAETFLPKLIEPMDKTYFIQLQTYMWLYDKPKAKLSYGLVDMPDFLIQDELRKLLYKMNVISDEDPLYKIEALKLLKNYTFGELPIHERVISHEISRDEEIIAMMPAKVEKAREFLAWFHEKHINSNKQNT